MQAAAEAAAGEANKLFVGGVAAEVSEDELRSHFAEYGEVRDVIVMRDRVTGRNRGFAFVEFADAAAADLALAEPDASRRVFRGRQVNVSKARPRGGIQGHVLPQQQYVYHNHIQNHPPFRNPDGVENVEITAEPRKIFVGGLRDDVTEEEFRSFFEKFGSIADVVVMYDSVTQRSRGFGFITFDTEEAAQNVLQKKYYELSGRMVEVKLAIPKDNHNNGQSSRTSRGRSQVSYQSHPQYNARYPYVPGYQPTYVAPLPYGGAGYVPYYYYGGYGGVSYGPWNVQASLVRGNTIQYGRVGYFPVSSDSRVDVGNANRAADFSHAGVDAAVYYQFDSLGGKVTQAGAGPNLHPSTVNDTLASHMGALQLES